ncbi:putative bifunctional diguanylate cyclase/phosphodiesterase [uncultured Jatrophihabitans sp.]|uniref:putative bifunctional diguanylate cyclase/phosphodiesterase n=1 Tax=uncultured Jatrophihabitans sp. TaxID=1610747 RepID=UPI0035CADE77
MSRAPSFTLRRLTVSSVFWYVSVLLGWPLLAVALVEMCTTSRIALAPAFGMTAALAVLLELRPLVQGRGHDPNGVVMSTAFIFALMSVWGPWPAIVMVGIGSLASDLRARKQWWKVLFNPAQYAISAAAAHLVLTLSAEHHPTLSQPSERFDLPSLGWLAAAWVVYFVVNDALVSGVLAWDGGFVGNFFDDFWHTALMTLAVLAMSPLVLIVGVSEWQLMPLLLIPLLLLYSTAQVALAREHEAGHDALTGLPNRSTLKFAVDEAFAAHVRDNSSFALMLIDLNDFKRVNDTLGHQVGDLLLVQLADRLRSAIRPGDVVGRLGGDEFAVLVHEVDEIEARVVAERIRASISDSVAIDTLTLEVSLSLGIAMCPAHGVDGTTLLRRADVAMYLAKERRSAVEIYSPERDENSADQLALLGELRQALLADEIQLHYQPKVAAADGRPLGVEALVRWQHPARGFLPPEQFIPLAERSGVMSLLTAKIIELALGQAATWRDQGLDLPVAVNISPADLVGAALPDLVAGHLRRLGLAPAALSLEITERMATSQLDEATRTLTALRDMGVRISLDDFGTGYSSLARLSSLPVDEIKIDRTFVAAMAQSDTAVRIVRALIDLAHALDFPAIAEGVETAEQWRVLRMLGCDSIQGWQVAGPMPAASVTDWLVARQSDALPRPLPQDEPSGLSASVG